MKRIALSDDLPRGDRGAAASLTGKHFALLVASSLVAPTGIVAVGLTTLDGSTRWRPRWPER